MCVYTNISDSTRSVNLVMRKVEIFRRAIKNMGGDFLFQICRGSRDRLTKTIYFPRRIDVFTHVLPVKYSKTEPQKGSGESTAWTPRFRAGRKDIGRKTSFTWLISFV
jgi:hypothetical protein